MAGLGELSTAVVRLADAADRAVFLFEAWSVAMGVVHPEDVGMHVPEKEEG
jgi:hypothetical protein